jgi:hypothetical protein
MNDWISLDDELPSSDESVLVYDSDFEIPFIAQHWENSKGICMWLDCNKKRCAPSHWMPLPPPPKGVA